MTGPFARPRVNEILAEITPKGLQLEMRDPHGRLPPNGSHSFRGRQAPHEDRVCPTIYKLEWSAALEGGSPHGHVVGESKRGSGIAAIENIFDARIIVGSDQSHPLCRRTARAEYRLGSFLFHPLVDSLQPVGIWYAIGICEGEDLPSRFLDSRVSRGVRSLPVFAQ
jgi:hypothetical protein